MRTLYLYLRPTGPAPRRKDEPMETPTPVFYYDPIQDAVDFGPWGPNGHIDIMDDAALVGCRMSARAVAELLRRRPDPAKAQAELAVARDEITRQTRNAVAWERTAALRKADIDHQHADLDRIGRVVAGVSAALDRLGAPAADTLAGRVEAYRVKLLDVKYVAGIAHKASQIAGLRASAREQNAYADKLETE